MAWNQPGGQNNSPWGRRPGSGGPGLDDKLRELQRKIEGFFRTAGASGAGGGEGEGSRSLVLLAVIVVSIIAASC